jgi:ketosteroid isomerase-like protein
MPASSGLFAEGEGVMMKIARYGFLLLAFVALDGQRGLTEDMEKSRILTLENAWNQAFELRDVTAIEPLLSAQLTYIDYDGTEMNKAQYLTSVNEPSLHFEHIANESMQVQVFGRSAVVIGVYQEKGTKNGMPYSHLERFVDAWTNRSGRWVVMASQATLIAP